MAASNGRDQPARRGLALGEGDPAIDEDGNLRRRDESGDHMRGPQFAGQCSNPFLPFRVEHQYERSGSKMHQAVQGDQAFFDVSSQIDQDHRAGQADQ